MATNDLDINIRLKDSASRGINSVNTSLGVLGTTVGGVAKSFAGMIGPIIAAVGAFKLLSASIKTVGESISLFADFDDAMRRTAAVTGATQKEFEQLTQVAKDLGETTRYTATQAAEAMTFLGMAGFEAGEIMSTLPDVLNLAAAGSLDLADAADIATNIMSGFGLGIDELARANDVLVKTFTSSNTSLYELGEGFKYVGPIASAVGVNFEDLLAAMGKLGDAGIKASLAGTTLRGTIEALFNPTNDEAKLMAELSERIGETGLVIRDSEGYFVGFAELIRQLEDAGLKGEEALRLFGQRAGPGIAALMQVGSKSLEELNEQLEKVDDTAKKVADKAESGMGGALRRLAAATEAFKIQLGEAFSKELEDTIVTLTQLMNDFADTVRDLEESGVIKFIADSIEVALKSIASIIDFTIATFKEASTALSIVLNTIIGNSEILQQQLEKIGSAYREVFQKRGLLASDAALQLEHVKSLIAQLEKEITLKQKIIAQDREDINSWRAKLLGAKAYQEQLAKHINELIILQKKADALGQTKIKLEIEVAAEEAIAEFKKTGKAIEDQSKPDGPIGRGAKKAGQVIEDNFVASGTLETKLKIEVEKLKVLLEKQKAELDANYSENLNTLHAYYEARRQIVETGINKELEVFKKLADRESDVDKRLEYESQYFIRREQLETELTNLIAEEYRKRVDLEKEFNQDSKDLEQAKIELSQHYINQRIAAEEAAASPMQARFDRELAALKSHYEESVSIVENYHNKVIELTKKRFNDIDAVLKASVDKEKALQNELAKYIEARNKLLLDQQKRLIEQNLTNAATLTGGYADVLSDLYEATGKKSKELFYLSKAAAIAEATINIALGITKALGQQGIFGIAQGALIAAKGAAQIALISAQQYAEGGLIHGKSPSSKSDDKIVRVTSGEYVQPVSSVKYYGMNAMEAIRQKVLPKDFFREVKNFRIPSPRYAFAEGGAVTNNSGFNVNVPVTVNAPPEMIDRLSRTLQAEIESTTIRVMREELS